MSNKQTFFARLGAACKKVDPKDPVWIFLGIVCLLAIVLFFQFLPNPLPSDSSRMMLVQVEHLKHDISQLDQGREIAASDEFFIRTIDFPGGNTMKHSKLGDFGFSKNFYAKIEGIIRVKREADYRLIVASDDGFRLKIADQTISEYTNDRPMSETATNHHLAKGDYPFEITWFQGFGQLGLRAWYSGPCGKKLFGESSDCIEFIPIGR